MFSSACAEQAVLPDASGTPAAVQEVALDASGTPAAIQVKALADELELNGYTLTLFDHTEEDTGNYAGRERWYFDCVEVPSVQCDIISDHGDILTQILLRTGTLQPGEGFLTLCRLIPETEALLLPEGIREVLSTIKLDNGAMVSYDTADDYAVRVGGVMDVRTVWTLNFPGFGL